MSYKLKIKGKTWNKDSYELFDYEAGDLQTAEFTSDRSGTLIRKGNQVKFIQENQTESFIENEILFFINEQAGQFSIGKNDQDIWQTLSTRVNEGKSSTLYLKENDVFKLGRVVFLVKKIKNPEDKQSISYYSNFLTSLKENYEFSEIKKNSIETNSSLSIVGENEVRENKRICRFCLSDTVLTENPLLNPCKCDGSMKYVHLFCLQSWLVNKLHLKKNKGVISVLWQNLSCELCKSTLPLTFHHNNNSYDLVDIKECYNPQKENNKPTLILESLSKDRKPVGLHFIDFSETNEISIVKILFKSNICKKKGRGNECEIKLTDISVSRLHTRIRMDKNHRLFIEDNNSKFGTLNLIREPLFLEEEKNFIQVGRSTFEIYATKKWFSTFSCISNL